MPSTAPNIIWRPQPGPQKALVDCPLPEVLYGGARGGGKTDGVLGKYAIKASRYGEGFNAVFFRRELPMLDDAIERSKQIYGPLGWYWRDQKKTWSAPNGARLRFRPLETVSDAQKYQGQNISDACVEEAGQYADPTPIRLLHAVLRSALGVPTQLILTCNPGGPGHHWLKVQYIDPAPLGMQIIRRRLPNGAEHRFVYIPSRVENNRALLERDPEYINRLYLVGSQALVDAWLRGDWSVIAGAYFPEWSTDKHVVQPFAIPAHWARVRAMDWGSAKPFSVGWYAISDGSLNLPRGAMVKYREWYGCSEPNVGLRLSAGEVAAGILARETPDEHFAAAVADPSIFAEDGGPSIAATMAANKVRWSPADNTRIPGWTELRSRLKGEEGKPQLVVMSNCTHTIRTLPTLQHDKGNAEDLDSDAEDHAADETRYAIMTQRPKSRPAAQREGRGRHDAGGAGWLSA